MNGINKLPFIIFELTTYGFILANKSETSILIAGINRGRNNIEMIFEFAYQLAA